MALVHNTLADAIVINYYMMLIHRLLSVGRILMVKHFWNASRTWWEWTEIGYQRRKTALSMFDLLSLALRWLWMLFLIPTCHWSSPSPPPPFSLPPPLPRSSPSPAPPPTPWSPPPSPQSPPPPPPSPSPPSLLLLLLGYLILLFLSPTAIPRSD